MKTEDIYNPNSVIITYKTKEGIYNNLSDDETYVEIAEVLNNKLGAFTPLSKKAALALGNALVESGGNVIGGFIHPRLLYAGFSIHDVEMIWYSDPGPQMLYYTPELQIPSGYFFMPWLVWQITSRTLNLFACIEKPGPETQLYKAPFHNTNSEGIVCMGTAYNILARNFTSFINTIKSVETAFYDTIFTGERDTSVIKGNLNSFHKKMITTQCPFPYNVLLKIKSKTVLSLIKDNNNAIQKETSEEG